MSVRRQVWESLVSMVRVYAHAAALNGVACDVTVSADDAVVTRRDGKLTIRCSEETGEGCWRLIHSGCEEWGEFHIDEHGVLMFPAGPKELDTAAIDWIDHLVHVGQSEANNLSSRPERSEVERSAVSVDDSPVLTEKL